MSKVSSIKKALVAGLASLGSLALVAGPADAASAGVFTGYEDAPASMLYTPPLTLCANFTPTTSAPLKETLLVDGGTVTFTNTSTSYDANPVGTFASGSQCISTPYSVPGDLQIVVGTVNCTTGGTGTYTRTAGSVVVIEGSCGGVTFTGIGAEVPCIDPPFATGCPSPIPPPYAGHDAILAGAYVLTP